MKLPVGAERKKVVFLGAVLLLGAYTFYTNVLSEPEIPAGAQRSVPKAAPGAQEVQGLPQPPQSGAKASEDRLRQRKMNLGRQSIGEYRPVLKSARKEDQPDPMKVDPTLRLELLAKLQNVNIEGGTRSLFDMGQPPPAKPDPKIDLKPLAKKDDKNVITVAPPPQEVKPPADPPPPPIPLKFYGFSALKSGGPKRAFFLEGEEIYVVYEGDLIKRRYKIVRIGLNSVVVADTQFKNREQTLPLEEPPATG